MQTLHSYATLKSPIGNIVLTSNGKNITGLYLPEQKEYELSKLGNHNPDIFQDAFLQLNEYFEGTRDTFSLAIEPIGTDFQIRVWAALNNIHYGDTKSYGEIAKILEQPKASRAVGTAIGRNPIGIIVPCHRVIGATGKLTGYAGGLKAKQWLLNHEMKFFVEEGNQSVTKRH